MKPKSLGFQNENEILDLNEIIILILLLLTCD